VTNESRRKHDMTGQKVIDPHYIQYVLLLYVCHCACVVHAVASIVAWIECSLFIQVAQPLRILNCNEINTRRSLSYEHVE